MEGLSKALEGGVLMTGRRKTKANYCLLDKVGHSELHLLCNLLSRIHMDVAGKH